MIEWAYQAAEQAGIPVWCQDEAGLYQMVPYPGSDWHEVGKPKQQPHEYFRDGTANLLTLFGPATGEARAKRVEHAPNAVLHPWPKEELLAIVAQQEKEHPLFSHSLTRRPMPSGVIGITDDGPMSGLSSVLAYA